MTISTQRPLPENIQEIQREMEKHAAGYGLDFFDTIFEMVDYEEMSMMAAYTGFPTRYPHWRFGAQFDELMKGYSYGLQKIYEMVINTDPCYAYLLSNNEMVDQKLVVAHVYGHCDFFKNNAWFGKTNRRMLDQMANNAARVNKYIDKYGYEVVERYIDACLSLEDLIDPYSVYKDGGFADPDEKKDDEDGPDGSGKFAAKQYMDPFINPPELIKKERERKAKEAAEREASRRFPEEPERDVLLFLMQYAPLQDWQRDVLSIIRDEAYYFAPQGMTKIMNEGWASYWHSTIMTKHGLNDSDFIFYANHHRGTKAMRPKRWNPCKIGNE
ncbi:MAG: SpoVR family protein, partial [Planctomycetaceae bacterium]